MQHPFQCIVTIKPPQIEPNSPGYLLAACGPKLSSICLTNGDIVSSWSAHDSLDISSAAAGHDENHRPAKKQKASSTTPNVKPLSSIIRLAVSPNNEYAIAVTDDKCILVFSIQSNGELHELSSRCMPKRPCAVQVLPDNATILCGDKFGDVYSLPLLPAIEAHPQNGSEATTTNADYPASTHNHSHPFKPAATNKTVHTQRNLKSLLSQQNQKNLTPKTKEPLKFEHKLLLGHVSMLTDVAYATREIEGRTRSYIITADRDEHIRVSRAPPQSHIIEGYCLGHREFISKICVVPGIDLLVSGGGDDWLGVWDWPGFKLRHRLALSEVFDTASIAVSGISIVAVGGKDVVLVTCEKSCTLAYVFVEDLLEDEYDGNLFTLGDWEASILDVALIGDTLLVSLDARGAEDKRLQAFSLQGTERGEVNLLSDDLMTGKLDQANGIHADTFDDKTLDSFLYNIENLRKRGYHEEAGVVGEEEPPEQPS